jgi:hypothetical protein
MSALVVLSGCTSGNSSSPSGALVATASDASVSAIDCGFDAQAQEISAKKFFRQLEEQYESMFDSFQRLPLFSRLDKNQRPPGF